jgi:hypothetical protein
MRLPALEPDAWTLESGEDRHAQYPESFELPAARQRASLGRGDAAKLLFHIESVCEHGDIEVLCERMWVVVTDVIAPYYIGRLTNQPTAVAQDPGFYLAEDVEVPFLPEHIIQIDRPPDVFLDALFSEPPLRTWPR